MMMVYFKVFNDFISIAEALDDAARGRLFLAILRYVNGRQQDPLTGGEQIAFLVLRNQIDRDRKEQEERAEVNRENGRLGGRPKGKTEMVSEKTEKTQMVISETEKTLTKNKTITKTKNNNKEDIHNLSRAALESEFDVLWGLYPKKQGKQIAFKAYCRDRKDGHTFEEIRKGVEAYANYIRTERTETKYIKQGATFFSQMAWDEGNQWISRKRTGASGVALIPEEEREEAVF